MSKKCAKCLKIVYPTEELKCLDKIWHKLCFKCEVCGMTLNMKNYKGFEKLPYCNAHCPTVKHTQVADTPETRRIAENTKIQSNIQYHADFEKQKGQKTSVAEDPELERIKQNTQIQSNVNYWGLKEQREQMEGKRPNETVDDVTRRSHNPGKISDYDPGEGSRDSRYSQRNSANVVYQSQKGEVHGQRVQPGSIADYDPLKQQHSSAGHSGYGQAQSNLPQPISTPVSRPDPPPAQQSRVLYRTIYDYTAADTDEVSFEDGDFIEGVEFVDEGWVVGTIQRTGQRGMLPSNYIERVN
uniref:SH3 domain-containing protein n=1 Tax=Arion vulgaris TaxID=1028688 RepID=A0A0B7AGE0_9EUPU